MPTAKFISVLILATQLVPSASARAETLADINARVISASLKKVSTVSNRTGAMHRRGIPASFGRTMDPDFRSMAKLAMRFEMSDGRIMTEHCGGSVISSRWIVTAAHCVSPDDGSRWSHIDIITGDRDLDGRNAVRRQAYDAIVHAGFEYASLSNDVALIRLSEPLPRSIVPVRLDNQDQPSVIEGGLAKTAGWPVTGSKAGAKRLQTTAVAVTPTELPGYITVTSPTGQVEGVCQGESGGPLMAWKDGTPSLAGVLSGIEPGTNNSEGDPCMIGGYEMYFTPISGYRKWIDEVQSACSHNPKMCATPSAAAYAAGTATLHKTDLASKRHPF